MKNYLRGKSMQGKIALKIYTHYLNSEYFIKTIRELKKNLQKITGNHEELFADNASYHTSKNITKYLKVSDSRD